MKEFDWTHLKLGQQKPVLKPLLLLKPGFFIQVWTKFVSYINTGQVKGSLSNAGGTEVQDSPAT